MGHKSHLQNSYTQSTNVEKIVRMYVMIFEPPLF